MDDGAFVRLMAVLGPFESAPVLAVAVSGGADSMALALLAHRWAAVRGGRVVAFTVDHGLRAEAAGEARQVHRWLTDLGIEHHILTRRGPAPQGAIQASARRWRYELLLAACRERGILHLLLAHQAEDQAETMVMRAARNEKAAAMAPISPPPLPGSRWPRLLRPLLGIGKGRLRQYLREHDQAWIEDPSNENPLFERVRVRRELAKNPDKITAYLKKADENHVFMKEQAAELARLAPVMVTFHATGWAEVDGAASARLRADVQKLFWQRLLAAVGGREQAPRGGRLAAFLAKIREPDFTAATLGGCRVIRRKNGWLVCREPAAITAQAGEGLWDGRFALTAPPGGQVVRLSEAHWRILKKTEAGEVLKGLPHVVRLGLPVWCDGAGGVHLFDFARPETTGGARFATALPFLF